MFVYRSNAACVCMCVWIQGAVRLLWLPYKHKQTHIHTCMSV